MNLARRLWRASRLALHRLGPRRRKIFAIGFNKTGTSSLHRLFQSMGYLSYHGVEWRSGENLGLLRSYDCFSDGTPRDFVALDRDFPGSKFILQVRELDKWILSRLAHIERMKVTGKHAGRATWDTTEFAVKHWIRQRNEHHVAVLSHFADRPSDLLVINFIRNEHAVAAIADFLGRSTEVEKPNRNRNPSDGKEARHIDLLHACVRDLGLTPEELHYDILCPSLLSPEIQSRLPADTDELPTRHNAPRS